MVLDSWLWEVEPSHFRVLFALVALAAPERTQHRSPIWGAVDVPAGGLVTSLDRLAERTGVTRAVVRRALERLAAGPMRDGSDGAITVASSPRGYTLITVTIPALLDGCAQQQTDTRSRVDGRNHLAPTGGVAQGQSRQEHSAEHSGDRASTAPSTAAVYENTGDIGGLHPTPTHREHSAEHSGGSGTVPKILGTQPALSDPDPDLKDDHPPAKRARVRAELITNPRAWDGADVLRARILALDPGNIIGRKPWGPDVKSGVRLTWANEIRLMVEQDHRGRTAPDKRDDELAYTEIARTVAWLFGHPEKGIDPQPGIDTKFRIVVESAGTLRAKWDQIQAARRRAAAPAAPRPTNTPPTAYKNPPARETWK